MEAIASGTPCVGFNIGGLPDMIEHQQNGYLAQPYDVQELAQGITWVLENPERQQKLGFAARQKAEKECSLEITGQRYSHLFADILGREKMLKSYEAIYENGQVRWLTEPPQIDAARIIIIIEETNTSVPKQRTPSAAIAGKGRTLGDIVSPIINEEDWECLK